MRNNQFHQLIQVLNPEDETIPESGVAPGVGTHLPKGVSGAPERYQSHGTPIQHATIMGKTARVVADEFDDG